MNELVCAEWWKPIRGYEGFYEISDKGRVKSLVGWNGHKYVCREKILKPSKSTTGALKVELKKNKVKKSFKLHRLVAAAFVQGEKEGYVVNHIDGNPENNNSVNLEWCTQSYNEKHAWATGLRKKKYTKDDILLLYCDLGKTQDETARVLGVDRTTILRSMQRYGIKARQSKYHIDISELKIMIDNNFSNKEIAEHFSCTTQLIARRKCQYKKGEI